MNEKFKKRFDLCVKGLNRRLYEIIMKIPDNIKTEIQEIHLRTNKPVCLYCGVHTYYVTNDSKIISYISDNVLISSANDITESFQNICNYSVYSKQSEIKNGFVTMKGGHRAGICGTAVYNERGIINIRDISSINLRISKEIKGVSEPLIKAVNLKKGGLLICGIPSSGKTTILRDVSRILSVERNLKVSVIDERGEIGGSYNGTTENDLGMCDILNGYKKTDGIMQAIRCMSPQIIICDEIGTEKEAECIKESLNSGVVVIASVHCANLKELTTKPQTVNLLSTGAFEYIVFLSDRKSPGKVDKIYTLEELKKYEDDRLYYDSDKYNIHRLLSVVSNKNENEVI